MNTMRTNIGRLAGAVGAVLLASTPLTWLLTETFGLWLWSKLLLGLLCVAVYLATDASFFQRLAGARSVTLLFMSSGTVALVLALIVAVNYLAYIHPKEIDFTREELFTLSKQTTDMLHKLNKDVHITAFFGSYEAPFALTSDALRRYQNQSKHVTFEMIDYQSRPDLVEKYSLRESGPRIIVESGDRQMRIKQASEHELTNAISKVTSLSGKKVYFIEGHGEGNIADAQKAEGYKLLADALSAEGYTVATFSLLVSNAQAKLGDALKVDAPDSNDAPTRLELPSDADTVILLGARSELLPPEVQALDDYLDRGGRLIVLLDPDIDIGLDKLLAGFKMVANADLVVDTNPLNRTLGLGPAAPMGLPAEPPHAITKDLTSSAVFMTVRSLGLSDGGLTSVETRPLLLSGATAWGETQLKDGEASRDNNDYPGPVALAMVSVRPRSRAVATNQTLEARLVVFGDADFVNNRYLGMQANNDLFLNTVNWVAEQEDRITIRLKKRASSQLFLSEDTINTLKFFSMDLLPVLLIAIGFSVVLIRRQK